MLDKRRLQGFVVAIKAVRNDRLEPDARSLRMLDQRQRDLRLGAKCRILPAFSQPHRWHVRHHMQRLVVFFVGPHGVSPQRYTVIDLAERAQALTRHMVGGAGVLAVTRVVNYRWLSRKLPPKLN